MLQGGGLSIILEADSRHRWVAKRKATSHFLISTSKLLKTSSAVICQAESCSSGGAGICFKGEQRRQSSSGRIPVMES
jgi:hypothetical protein